MGTMMMTLDTYRLETAPIARAITCDVLAVVLEGSVIEAVKGPESQSKSSNPSQIAADQMPSKGMYPCLNWAFAGSDHDAALCQSTRQEAPPG